MEVEVQLQMKTILRRTFYSDCNMQSVLGYVPTGKTYCNLMHSESEIAMKVEHAYCNRILSKSVTSHHPIFFLIATNNVLVNG